MLWFVWKCKSNQLALCFRPCDWRQRVSGLISLCHRWQGWSLSSMLPRDFQKHRLANAYLGPHLLFEAERCKAVLLYTSVLCSLYGYFGQESVRFWIKSFRETWDSWREKQMSIFKHKRSHRQISKYAYNWDDFRILSSISEDESCTRKPI